MSERINVTVPKAHGYTAGRQLASSHDKMVPQ